MNQHPPTAAEEANSEDNDPWTFFGSYSEEDIAVIRTFLQREGIQFHITHESKTISRLGKHNTSIAPYHLWVRDEYVEKARSILVPYFGEYE